MDIQAEKATWRRSFRLRLRSMDPTTRTAGSAAITERLKHLPEYSQAKALLAFVPRPDEPALWPIIQSLLNQNRRVALPSYDPNSQRYVLRLASRDPADWIQGPWGIAEPAPTAPQIDGNQLDFALVPGLGFSPDGSRLGRGKGYMDCLLASLSGFKCGVAFDEQMIETLPVEPHDVPLDCILTPSREWRRPSARF